jgi:hypothetical protein
VLCWRLSRVFRCCISVLPRFSLRWQNTSRLACPRFRILYWLNGTSVQEKPLLRRKECAFTGCKWMAPRITCEDVSVCSQDNPNINVSFRRSSAFVNPIHSCLKRLVGMSVNVLRTRFVHWTKPLTSSLTFGIPADLARSKAERVRRKCALTTTTYHPQAAGETASMHQYGSHASRARSSGCSDLEANALDRSTRHPPTLAS